MAFGFREYRPKQEKPKIKIPVIRILLVLAGIFLVYRAVSNSGILTAAKNYLKPLPAEKPAENKTWEEHCLSLSGTPFQLREGVMQCSWAITPGDSLKAYPSILLYTLSVKDSLLPFKIHWVGDGNDFNNAWFFGIEKENEREWFFHVPLPDSSLIWVTEKAECFYPGFCPQNPLEGGVLSIAEDFDFEGRENLITKDLFMGIGETPVFPVLSGRVLSTGKDSLGYRIEIDHGDNLMSRYSGLFSMDSVQPGDILTRENAFARLAPKDSSCFYLEILRNGKFVRWKDFFTGSYPLPDTVISKFRTMIRF
ncbi:MAG: M23 family metallopeptidase [Fibrobacter sp.]|jgi:hypothetical protein|nr:M23 family metallopeptidase [Fibrobacter sp.]